MAINKVILIGHLGSDPTVRTLPDGGKVAQVNLATTEVFGRGEEKKEHTEWHRLVFWRGLAEITETWLKKGSHIYIEGRLRTTSWEDENKVKRYNTDIHVDNMQMLGRRGSSDNASGYVPVDVQGADAVRDGERISPPETTNYATTPESSKPAPVTVKKEDEDDLPF